MIKRPDDIPNYLQLVANLEEFGLSKYESMAYITLASRGTLGASEIAYYSNLPRTKIYTTLKKLEKKYLTLEPNVVVQKIKELISSSKSNIDLTLDSWGQNVVFQCKPSITGATKKGVKIKMLLGNESIISDGIGTFPDGVEIRSDTVSGNILIFDY